MSHRDARRYRDIGRDELPDEAITWMDEMRQSFDIALLSGMGIQRFREAAIIASQDAEPSDAGNPSMRELASASVNMVLAGSLKLMELGREADGEDFGVVLAEFVNGFVVAVCAAPDLWSECLTALVRRCVTAWARVEVSPEIADIISTSSVHADEGVFLAAVSTTSADDDPVGLADRSREAVYRVTAWLNGKSDLRSALAAAFTVATTLMTAALVFEDEEVDRQAWMMQLGAEADALLGA